MQILLAKFDDPKYHMKERSDKMNLDVTMLQNSYRKWLTKPYGILSSPGHVCCYGMHASRSYTEADVRRADLCLFGKRDKKFH